MAMVRSVTITTVVNPAGEITGHTVSAHVEVAGDEQVQEFTQDAELTSLAEQIVRRIHRDALEAERSRAQGVVNAEGAFD